jgi:SAM-dependent methyltransferase
MDAATVGRLLEPVVRQSDMAWADVGAGFGTFTRGLVAAMDPNGVVFAVDNNRRALDDLRALARSDGGGSQARIVVLEGDLESLPATPPLDGILLGNVLHFVPDEAQRGVLAALRSRLRDDGRVVVIEYDGRLADRWVPHPVRQRRLTALAEDAGYSPPRVTGSEPSAYGGVLYVAVLEAGPP